MQLIDQNLESFKSSKPVTLIDGIETVFKDQISTYRNEYQAKFKELHKVLLAQAKAETPKLEYFQWLNFDYLKNLNDLKTKPLASKLKGQGYENLVIVGMGGSGINSLVLNNGLREFTKLDESALKIFIQNNLDSSSMQSRLESLGDDIEKTLFVIISKSGGTDEVRRNLYSIIAYQIAKRPEKLKDLYRSIILITEPEREEKKNFLHEFKKEVKTKFDVDIPVLENHPEIGGRFSMFSPVGMFTAELIGLNSTALLEGAEACFHDFVNQEELHDSKVANLALIDIMLSDLAYVHRYSMVYADSLEATNKFRAQLKGESLNKNGIVSTVHIAGIGTVNHHSDLELLFKDNNNLILEQIYFMKPAYETVNPKINLEILKDLENESNHASLIKNHIKPLRTYLIEKGNPVLTTVLPEQNEYNLAYFLFQDMLVTIVQAGIQDPIGCFEKLDLSIRQWEVEKYKKSLSK